MAFRKAETVRKLRPENNWFSPQHKAMPPSVPTDLGGFSCLWQTWHQKTNILRHNGEGCAIFCDITAKSFLTTTTRKEDGKFPRHETMSLDSWCKSYFQSVKIYFQSLKINFHDVKINFHVMKIDFQSLKINFHVMKITLWRVARSFVCCLYKFCIAARVEARHVNLR